MFRVLCKVGEVEMEDLKEVQMREMVVGLLCAEKEKVIKEIVEYWDREGEGCFASFMQLNFPAYWLEKVGRN